MKAFSCAVLTQASSENVMRYEWSLRLIRGQSITAIGFFWGYLRIPWFFASETMLWVWRPDFSARSLAAQSTRRSHHFCGCCAFCATTVVGIGLFRHCHFQSFDSSIYLMTFAVAAWRLQAGFRRHRSPQSLRFCFSRPHSVDLTFFSHFKRIISPITRDRSVCRWAGLSIQSSLGSCVPFMHNKLLFSFSWHFTTHSGNFSNSLLFLLARFELGVENLLKITPAWLKN